MYNTVIHLMSRHSFIYILLFIHKTSLTFYLHAQISDIAQVRTRADFIVGAMHLILSSWSVTLEKTTGIELMIMLPLKWLL